MNTSFQQLQKEDEKFQEYLRRGDGIFEEFFEFVRQETIECGNVRKRTDKPRSYFVSMIRLIYAYEFYYGCIIEDIASMDCYRKLKNFMELPEMTKINRESRRFYSAPLSSFYKFLLKYLEADYVDDRKTSIDFLDEVDLDTSSDARAEKVFLNNRFIYPRNPKITQEAKKRANWKCDMDADHITFTSQFDDNPYMEAHHLIPMAVQDFYENSLDFVGNIICLCPTCHRKIHYAIDSDKREMLQALFKKRKQAYEDKGISITLGELYKHYGM
ncbi:HNH endonuclease [Veillonella sp. CHU110]|uniref:HNH endonuclease n=1 Tax=Veillonella sp. CHU110 TaxID=2490947 RepID=UPI00197D7455|nr:HNH endonuclease [Veillonella sp. CHU110]